MRSPDNLERPNSSETHGGVVPTSVSTRRALGRSALSSAGARTPEDLERAANELEAVSRALIQVAQRTQEYQGRITPIARGVEQEVGGSATGMDKQISSLLTEAAKDVATSASASHQAAQVARKLAAQARAEAQDMRRRQEAEQQERRR